MIVHDIDQRSDEWDELRRGVPTASNADMYATPTGLPSKSASKLVAKLCADLKVGSEDEDVKSAWMQHGIDTERKARAWFSVETGLRTVEVGFITNDEKTAGASPDSLLMDGDKYVAGLELKCPMAKTHVEYLLAGEVPKEYRTQIAHSMIVSGLRVWYFMSYYPGIEPVIIKVEWDEYTDKVQKAFNAMLDKLSAAKERLGL
jgi:putative phage-type endonuclease